MTLYLKYRPKNLDELDLADVGESLKKIVSKKNIPHAFLFAGPKGTGKTSAARILAKIINCEDVAKSEKLKKKSYEPCDKCPQCVSITNGSNLDVIEMDAASHRGIDDVRVLRDAVKLAPVSAKKKIYIIDEAHMLTTEASNALLKTLEEPPNHVVFILATTNPEKLIGTIRSRTTHIPFRKATDTEIVKSLKRVVAGEKIKIDDDALSSIAKASDGSFRDGIKILEQLVAEEKDLTNDFLEEYLFRKKDYDLDKFIEFLVNKDVKNLITETGKLGSKGVAIEMFSEALLKKLRCSLLAKVGIGADEIPNLEKHELIKLIELLQDATEKLANSPIEELPLEVAIIKWCGDEKASGVGRQESEDENKEAEIVNQKSEKEPRAEENTLDSRFMIQDSGVGDDIWKSILSLIKPINASVEALLRSAKPMTYNGKVLTLGVFYKFHKERLEETKHRKIVEETIAKVLQSPTKIVCTLVEPPPRKIVEETKIDTVLTEGKDKDIIKAAEEIFGN